MSINPKFRTPLWRPFRAGMFVAYGLCAVFPVFHGLRLYGYEMMKQSIGLHWVVLQGFLYIFGAGIYAVSRASLELSEVIVDCKWLMLQNH